jgi:multicomponent Na+:H+ antiporter subunit B
LTLLTVLASAIVYQRSLFAVVVLSTSYSFLMATVLVFLDAVDVAMTEAAVGAGISTVLLLATLHLVKTTEMRSVRPQPIALLVAVGVGTLLIWGTSALPPFGAADAVIHSHVVPRYLGETIKETGVPNVVTSVLADYRGYDTLGETTVIFTAAIGVMLLLRRRRRRGHPGHDEAAQ